MYSAAGTQLTSRTITEKLGNPFGLFLDKSGNVYEADRLNKASKRTTRKGSS